MKVYFGFTVAGDRSSVEVARRLVELLESMGHEVLTRHLVSAHGPRYRSIGGFRARYGLVA
jgi:hypothetical protein